MNKKEAEKICNIILYWYCIILGVLMLIGLLVWIAYMLISMISFNKLALIFVFPTLPIFVIAIRWLYIYIKGITKLDNSDFPRINF